MRLTITAIAALAACAAIAPAAYAEDRYVEPGGQASGACTDPTPGNRCDLEWAVEAAAAVNDNVILAPGTYTEASPITIGDEGVDLIGPGTTQATLNSSAATGLEMPENDTSVSGLTIQHTGSGDGLLLDGSTRVERLSVSTTFGNSACHAMLPTQIRDTACRNTSAGGAAALLVDPDGPPNGGNFRLRNVTAYATGSLANGIRLSATTSAGATVNARNSIFRAVGLSADISASTDTSVNVDAEVDADYSAYVDVVAFNSGGATPPGTLNNIVSLPLFESAAGNFHQAAGSPTIDRGTTGVTMPALGALDIDGEARIMGSAPDIGADEFVPPPAQQQPPPAVPVPPASRPATCPKGKKLVKKRGKRKCVRKKKRRR